MPGDGTKLARTTADPPPARVLDLTRTLRRAGRRATGIDRVERAYLRHYMSHPTPLFGLARTRLGYLLLDPAGLATAMDGLTGARFDARPDLLSRLQPGLSADVARMESHLRGLALGRCRPSGLSRLLGKHVPAGAAYLNVGHSQWTNTAFAAIRAGIGGRIAVLVHDTIPLDHPADQRTGTPDVFRDGLRAVGGMADAIVTTSAFAAARIAAHLPDAPQAHVAPLGLDACDPDPSGLPGGITPEPPFFVTIGTIEPRKGHDLLLDVWDMLSKDGGPVPHLYICGARGWENRAVFDRLDKMPKGGPVFEWPGIDDAALFALLAKAQALLFPSRAEGYGLPPLEAAALGTPVVLAPLPVYRETLGHIPVYAKETDRYLWRNTVTRLSSRAGRQAEADKTAHFAPPTWSAHFETVSRVT